MEVVRLVALVGCRCRKSNDSGRSSHCGFTQKVFAHKEKDIDAQLVVSLQRDFISEEAGRLRNSSQPEKKVSRLKIWE